MRRENYCHGCCFFAVRYAMGVFLAFSINSPVALNASSVTPLYSTSPEVRKNTSGEVWSWIWTLAPRPLSLPYRMEYGKFHTK